MWLEPSLRFYRDSCPNVNWARFITLLCATHMSVWLTRELRLPHHAYVDFYAEFGERVRRAREGRFTQTELARRVGLSRGSIANIEVGRQRVPLHMLAVLARELDVDPATLMPTGGAGADVVVPEDRLERLHPDDAKDVVKVVRRAREERGGYSGQG